MGTHNRPTPGDLDLIVARLQGIATRLGRWDPPVGQERQLAVHDLQQLGGQDPEAYAKAAGIMLGTHPRGDSSHRLYRHAADLILEAAGLAEDDERVRFWIRVGEERRSRTHEARRTGDRHGKDGWL